MNTKDAEGEMIVAKTDWIAFSCREGVRRV